MPALNSYEFPHPSMMVGQVSNLGAIGTIGQLDKMEKAALSLTHPGAP
jgi:hypothetical protein